MRWIMRTMGAVMICGSAWHAGAQDRLPPIAADKGCTPAQLAIAWLLSRGQDVIPIPGSTRAERVEENSAAASITLSPDELDALDRVATSVAGDRYPEGGMRAINR